MTRYPGCGRTGGRATACSGPRSRSHERKVPAVPSVHHRGERQDNSPIPVNNGRPPWALLTKWYGRP
jgi:hypothetical protein